VITERTLVPARYRLLEEVGQGGMAVVYRAQDEKLKREVAIKVLHPHLWSEPESKARLEREAQAVAKLKHDNILEIFDYSGRDAESAYIVTEFIDGQTLTQFLAAHKIQHPEIAALIAAELAGALAHAHGLGIIHRDVKPENVMIRKDGLLKLMDFGIAQVLDMERMTVTGQLLGSPAYMAPELIEGRPLDVRTDVFSVGILLYQLATGTLPFSGKNPHEVLRRITEGRFTDARVHNRLCGAGICRIIARALAHDPSERYPEMTALLTDLRDDLNQAGVVELRDELRTYFRDPAAYEKALPTRMTPALTASAQRHLVAQTPGRAIECWNRVLAYAPTDGAVLSALKRLEGRNRLRKLTRYGALAAGGLVAAVGIVAGLSHGRSGEISPPASSPPAVQTQSRPSQPLALSPAARGGPLAKAPGLGAGPVAAGALAHFQPGSGHLVHPRSPGGVDRIAVTEKEGEEKLSPSGSVDNGVIRTFTLGPTPQNVDVYLDGQRQFSYDTDHRTLQVAWNGDHVVEFRSPSGCCFVERIELGPDHPAPPDDIIARQLKWRPARLVITTSPAVAKARVMVRDPAHPSRGTVVESGEEANIAFFPTDEGQKEVDVSVDSVAGYATERVTVRAGESKSVEITLGSAP